MMRSALLLFLLAPLQAQGTPGTPATLFRGSVITMDRALPRASAVVVRGAIIEAVGGESLATAILSEPGTREIVLPEGAVLLPGLIESHAHFRALGALGRELDLREARSPAGVEELVRAAAARVPDGGWIRGRGWNQELWPDRAMPDAHLLDRAAPAHPVLLTRVDGHAIWVNGVAMRIAGIDATTPDPPGGEILRRGDGSPSGILVDNATALVERHLPSAQHSFEEDCLAAQAEAFAHGITTFVDAGAPIDEVIRLHRLYQERKLRIRLYAMIGAGSEDELRRATGAPPIRSAHEDRVAVRAIKIYADGALGSRGAWLLEPYADRSEHSGLATAPPGLLELAARLGLERNWQICVHAIGDRAVRETLDAFEAAMRAAPGGPRDHRFRIEHAQIVAEPDVPRFARLGVIASMQTCHAISDGPWVAARLGESRARARAYPWRRLLDAGALIANGTDAPVEDLSPWRNFEAAILRHLSDPGQDGSPCFPEQRMNRLEALRSLTSSGAYAAFAEDRRGRIRPGYQADLCVVDADPLLAPVPSLRGIRTLGTWVAGEPVYRAPTWP